MGLNLAPVAARGGRDGERAGRRSPQCPGERERVALAPSSGGPPPYPPPTPAFFLSSPHRPRPGGFVFGVALCPTPCVWVECGVLLLVLCVLVVRASRSRRDERVSFNASPCSVVWARCVGARARARPARRGCAVRALESMKFGPVCIFILGRRSCVCISMLYHVKTTRQTRGCLPQNERSFRFIGQGVGAPI